MLEDLSQGADHCYGQRLFEEGAALAKPNSSATAKPIFASARRGLIDAASLVHASHCSSVKSTAGTHSGRAA